MSLLSVCFSIVASGKEDEKKQTDECVSKRSKRFNSKYSSLMFFFYVLYTFLYKQPIVQLSLQLLSEVPKNEAESCYEVAYVFDDYWLKFGK